MRFSRPLLLLAIGLAIPASPSVADSFVDWNPSADVEPEAVWRLPTQPVATTGPRVVVKDGHFSLAGRRFRAWGVNLSFNANLPAPNDAAMVADRLAAAGVNAVRMHHMDSAKFPRGLWHRDGGFRLDPEGLARLDGFIAELARHGIRVNLNLHVGAQYSAMLDGVPDSPTHYDKVCLQFVPQLQQAWRDYASMLLDHRNRQRGGLRYADDPAIAWVEVSNENSFWFGDGLDRLRNAPESDFYRTMLEGQYATWLRTRYTNDAEWRSAWNVKSEPLGKDLLAPVESDHPWIVERHEGALAKRTPIKHGGQAGVRLEPEKTTGQGWHLQYNLRPIPLKKGKYYTLRFVAGADSERTLHAAVGMAHDPWGSLGLSMPVKLDREWKCHRIGFVAGADDDNARVTFSFGDGKTPFELAGVKLQRGGQVGIGPGESLDTGKIRLWGESETPERADDRLRFLAATEKKFFDMAREFIQEKIGCKALLVGTQGYGPMGLYAQAGMDFTDTHAYWQHPHFPRRPWDPNDWTIGRMAMVDHPERATFLNLAANRIPGRPFTVSEYNHPAPNDFQVECVPMIAAVAAAEDWDGVWFYTYEHNNDRWNQPLMGSYFDLRANPAKWAFMPTGAVLFREAGIGPVKGSFLSALAPPDAQTAWANPGAAMERYRFNRSGQGKAASELGKRFYRMHDASTGTTGPGSPPTPPDREFFMVKGSGGAVCVGYGADFAKAADGVLKIEAPEFCAVTLAAMDGRPAEESRRMLLTACGRAENRGMVFNKSRTTVGRNWGKPPVRAEAVTGSLSLPPANWHAWALQPDGLKGKEIKVEMVKGRSVLRMSPEHRTLCYWLER